MPKGRSIAHSAATFLLFVALEVVGSLCLSRSGPVQNLFFSKAVHGVMASLWGGSESVKYLFSLRKDNQKLAQENFTLRQLLLEHGEDLDRTRLDSLTAAMAKGHSTSDWRYIPATIAKSGRNKQHNYLILNQGFEDGVEQHSGIVSSRGVIGIVESVSKHHAYALSFLNSDINVSVRIGREGAIGPMSWDGKGSRSALLKEIPLQNKFAEGDTVYTSGFSSIFPPDIPLGVTGKSKIVNGATYEIEIELLEDFSSLRYVSIVSNLGKDEIDSLEEEAR